MNTQPLLTTSTSGRKRQMVYVPSIHPSSFLFFYECGDTGYSYSLRDYSVQNRVTERYAREFRYTAEQIRRMAKHVVDAPYMNTKLIRQWHEYTLELNQHFGLTTSDLEVQP